MKQDFLVCLRLSITSRFIARLIVVVVFHKCIRYFQIQYCTFWCEGCNINNLFERMSYLASVTLIL